MFLEIKNKVEQELLSSLSALNKLYSLSSISSLLFEKIKEFALRNGKRVRPILFVIGYLGFAKKTAPGLYRGAISFELLHDFFLVHDDIIDKSDTRRGRPSMHAMLNKYLSGYHHIKFNGEDLTIVTGDIMYAMSLNSFLSIKEKTERKERALKKFIAMAVCTASGEFMELLYGLKNIDKIKKTDIYKIYDFKTANYTFASPLTIGATLAGAKQIQIDRLFEYGKYLGRAFQIKDDILGIFGEENKIGKSNLTDLKEAKKTILIWYAYQNSNQINKSSIKRILSKPKVNKTDLRKMRRLIVASGALDYAKKEISLFIKKAQSLNASIKMRTKYKDMLSDFSQEILKL
jgi:geranylgeranyl diphosphate synthase type I